MACSINPTVRVDEADDLEAARPVRRVTVVGGGVSGLAAARAAALRGHDVHLIERDEALGGRLRIAARYSAAYRWPLYVEWLEGEIDATGVTVSRGMVPSVDDLLSDEPDTIIVATGSRLREAAIPAGPIRVADADELLAQTPPTPHPGAERALVVDDAGDLATAAASEILVGGGWAVEILTSQTSVFCQLDPTQLPFVLRDAARAGVRLTPNTELVRSERDARVIVRDLYADTADTRSGVGLIVLCGFRQANRHLAQELAQTWPDAEVHVVGDALAPRRLLDAVREGHHAGATCAKVTGNHRRLRA